ncbi:protein ZNF365 [Engraulis encrasicolus]|uniref:protein ZNF365 n=1 Tax=Engraulis encrasicolus TaxID=184585 RepID=UPI002FD44A68
MSRGLPLSMEGAKEELREGATREGSVCRGAGEAKAEGVKAVSSLPFRCPRCGENTRFRSLASLRAHLQLSHTFPSEPVQRSHTHTSSPVQGSHTGHIGPSVHKPPPPNNSLNQWDDCAAPPISPLMATGHAPPISMVTGSAPHVSMVTGPGPPISTATGPTPPVSTVTAATSPPGACGRMDVEFRLRGALQRAEGLLKQRLQSEHAQRSLLLARQQHCRQMTSAAMVIASLRQQLNTSQHLLQQRESEMEGMQSWLAVASRHELQSKEHLRNFMENILTHTHHTNVQRYVAVLHRNQWAKLGSRGEKLLLLCLWTLALIFSSPAAVKADLAVGQNKVCQGDSPLQQP